MMRYYSQPGGTYGGYIGNQGAVAGGNPLLDPRFKIQGGEPWNKTPILPGKETKDFENQPFPAPALPPAGSNLLAQGMPPMGNAGALGGAMQMGGLMQQGAPQGPAQPNVFSFRPNMKYLNPEEGGLQFGGELNIPLGEKGRINATGTYYPETNSVSATGTVGQPKGLPGFGIDFFVNRRLNQNQNTNVPGPGPQNLNDAGAYARYSGRF
jgi:hypothetical protein